MRRENIIVVIMAVVVLSMPIFAGGQQGGVSGSNPTANPWTEGQDLSGRTVNIFGAIVDVDAERFLTSMAPFEEQTGIDIVYEGSDDFESLITIRVEDGAPPDIAAFPQLDLLTDLLRRGHIVDVGQWLSRTHLSDHYSDVWLKLSTIDGKISGVWYRASLKSLVWYAKPIF